MAIGCTGGKKIRTFSHYLPQNNVTPLLLKDSLFAGIIKVIRKHVSISTGGEITYNPHACRFLKIRHIIFLFIFWQRGKSILYRKMQYI
jgi:hypothetical protein